MGNPNERLAVRVSRNCIAGNLILTGFKLWAGIFANSSAMISDAAHSLSDVFGAVVVIIGVKAANRRPDKEHPYGHERFDCVAAICLSAVLFATGAIMGWTCLQRVTSGNYKDLPAPGLIALIAAVASIAVKEAMYWYTRSAAKKTDSAALMAEAWHHRSDALSSVGSFVGVLGARMGFPVTDPLACVVICIFILKVAADIFRNAIGRMTDKACDDKTDHAMRELILAQESVKGIDQLRTRLFGDKIYVDVEIIADGSITLNAAHDAAQCVHDAIEKEFPKVKHCMVHVNPVRSGPALADNTKSNGIE